MSATAVAALTELLHACLAQQAMPTLQDIMKDRQEKLDSSGMRCHQDAWRLQPKLSSSSITAGCKLHCQAEDH